MNLLKRFRHLLDSIFYTFRGRVLLSLLFISIIPIIIFSYLTNQTVNKSITITGDEIKTELIHYVEQLYSENIDQQADLFISQLNSYSKQLLQLRALAEDILANPTSTDQYELNLTDEADGYAWEEMTGDRSNVGVSAKHQLTDEHILELEATKKLESSFRKLYSNNEEIVAIYYISNMSTWRIYPKMDVKSEIENGYLKYNVDLTKEIFYEVTHKGLLNNGIGWTSLYEDITHRDPMVSVATPIYKQDEQIGIIAADITVPKLVEHLISFEFYDDDSYTLLTDDEYNLIAYQDQAIEDLNELSPQFLKEVMKNNKTVMKSINDHNKLFLTVPIDPTGWQLTFVIPEEKITAQVTSVVNDQLSNYHDNFTNQMIAVFSLLFMLILIVSFAFWSNFTKPIRTILKGINSFQANNLDTNLPEQNLNEFNVLSDSLNAMMHKINQLTNNYRQLNIELEDKVVKRTEQLQLINTSLIQANMMLNNMEQEKNKLLTDVTHDLKTPLTLVSGYLDALQQGYIAENEIEQYINKIANYLESINELIKDIDHIGKDTIVNTTTQLQPLDPVSFILEIKEAFSAQENIQFKIHGQLAFIYADKYMLKRVILNLIENSIKYADGTVNINVIAKQDNDNLLITVQDDGWGIYEDALPHIFKRHYRSDEAMQSQNIGEGVGLSIVKEIIDLHHGTIDVHSKYEKGTEFIIKIPSI